jgi:hypothetical protein
VISLLYDGLDHHKIGALPFWGVSEEIDASGLNEEKAAFQGAARFSPF